MARNPWSSLPDSPPFVLADDKRAIEAFNQKAKKNAIIQTDMLPEPFVGSLHAPVFVLLENLGAGGGEEDFALHRQPLILVDVLRGVGLCLQTGVPFLVGL